VKKKMQKTNGTTGNSSDHFEEFTASIPDVIEAPAGEVLPPGAAPGGPGEAPPGEPGSWEQWDVEQIVSLPFFFLAKKYGEMWELGEKEKTNLGRVWCRILDKVLPLDNPVTGPWASAALCTAAEVGPRVMCTDWKSTPKKQTVSTSTVGSTESPSSPASGEAAKPEDWEVPVQPSGD